MALLTNIAGFSKGRKVGLNIAAYNQLLQGNQVDPIFYAGGSAPIQPAVQGDTGLPTQVGPDAALPDGATPADTTTPVTTPTDTPGATDTPVNGNTKLPVDYTSALLVGAYVLWVTFSENKYRHVVALAGLGTLYYKLKKQSPNG